MNQTTAKADIGTPEPHHGSDPESARPATRKRLALTVTALVLIALVAVACVWAGIANERAQQSRRRDQVLWIRSDYFYATEGLTGENGPFQPSPHITDPADWPDDMTVPGQRGHLKAAIDDYNRIDPRHATSLNALRDAMGKDLRERHRHPDQSHPDHNNEHRFLKWCAQPAQLEYAHNTYNADGSIIHHEGDPANNGGVITNYKFSKGKQNGAYPDYRRAETPTP